MVELERMRGENPDRWATRYRNRWAVYDARRGVLALDVDRETASRMLDQHGPEHVTCLPDGDNGR